jgi:hypothetical protein
MQRRATNDLYRWKRTLPGTWRKSPFGDREGNWKERTFSLSCKRRNTEAVPAPVAHPTVRLSWSEGREEHGHGYLIFDRAAANPQVPVEAEPNGLPAAFPSAATFPAGPCTTFNVGAPRYFGFGESTKFCVALHRATMSKKDQVGGHAGFLRIVKTGPNAAAVAAAVAELQTAITEARNNCM